MMMESALSIGFRTVGGRCSSLAIANYRPLWSPDDATGVHISSRRLSHASGLDVPWNRFWRHIDGYSFTTRNNLLQNRVRATADHSGSASNPWEQNGKPSYHPFEEIAESVAQGGGDVRLTAAETTRTIIEINSEATLLFSGLVNDEVEENIYWPELPYATDEHGNIYFQVNNDEDILQSLTSENNFVQVIIGLDTMEMLREMELSGPSEIDFGFEDIIEEGSDDIDDDDDEEDVDDEKEWLAILEDELGFDDTLGDWAKLETMRSSHPLHFAKKVAEVASDLPMDWRDQPSSGLAIHGLLRPAFIEEHPVIRTHKSGHESSKDNTNQVRKILEDKLEDLGMLNGHQHHSASSKDISVWAEELEKDEHLRAGSSFYKLEMVKIQLISSHGHQTVVEVKDFQKALPDAIAHSATKIISRLKAGGEKTTQAFKSLCWRSKGIQVEEVTLVGLDCLGFDLRVCSGTQVQTLRFAFITRATSEYGAERQLHDLLFPRIHHRLQKRQQAHPNEC